MDTFSNLSRQDIKLKLASVRDGKVDSTYLLLLMLDHKHNKKERNPDYVMPDVLGEIVNIIIDKMLDSQTWYKYPDDWKEEMHDNALHHVLIHLERYSPESSIKNNRKIDPYNWVALIIASSFINAWRKIKIREEFLAKANEIVKIYKPLTGME